MSRGLLRQRPSSSPPLPPGENGCHLREGRKQRGGRHSLPLHEPARMTLPLPARAGTDTAAPLLRVWDDSEDAIGVIRDNKIEPVVPVHSPLPHVVGATIFFGIERGVTQVALQEGQLLSRQSFQFWGKMGKILAGFFGEFNLHAYSLNFLPSSVSSHTSKCSMLLNAGVSRPARTSSKATASAASISGWRGATSCRGSSSLTLSPRAYSSLPLWIAFISSGVASSAGLRRRSAAAA